MIFSGSIRIESKVELVIPAEFKACLGDGVVTLLSGGVSLGKIGGMGSNLLGDYPFSNVIPIR